MTKLEIISIDDEREVLAALRRDLVAFYQYCNLTFCESSEEAAEVLEELDAKGAAIALIICDHIMPGKNGIDFLIEMNRDMRFNATKRLLITGLATHQDTIQAINEAEIDRYIEKPWVTQHLHQTVKTLLTEYVLENGIDYQIFLEILDQSTLLRYLRRTTG
jgi:two-component system chemotaxis response regulator CheY